MPFKNLNRGPVELVWNVPVSLGTQHDLTPGDAKRVSSRISARFDLVPILEEVEMYIQCGGGSAVLNEATGLMEQTCRTEASISLVGDVAGSDTQNFENDLATINSLSESGFMRVTGEFEEWFDFYLLPSELVDSVGFPREHYDPALEAIADGYAAYGIRYFLKAVPASTLVLEIQTTNISLTVNCTATGMILHPKRTVAIAARADSLSGGYEFTAEAHPEYRGFTWAIPNPLAFVDSGGFIADCRDGVKATVTTGSGFGHAIAVIEQTPDICMTLDGRARMDKEPYPNPTQVAWLNRSDNIGNPFAESLTFTGEISDSHIQHEYVWAADANGWTDGGGFSDMLTKSRVSIIENPTQDEDAWRCGILGKNTPGLSIGLETTDVWDGSSLTGWAAGSNTSIEYTSGTHVEVAGGTGSAEFTCDPVISEGYGYLRVRLDPFDAGVLLDFAIGSKQWLQVAPVNEGGLGSYFLHLIAPTNNAIATDDQQYRLPLTEEGGSPQFEGPMWGKNLIDSVELINLPDGSDFLVTSIRLVKRFTEKVNSLKELEHYIEHWPERDWVNPSTPVASFARPAVWMEVDGRKAGDFYDIFNETYFDPVIGTFTVYEFPKIGPGVWAKNNMADQIRHITGWDVIVAAGSDDFHTPENLPAAWLSDGAVRSHFDGTWIEQLDITNGLLRAQPKWDEVSGIYVGQGNSWEGTTWGGYDDPLPICFNWTSRAVAQGSVFNLDMEPIDAAPLRVDNSPHAGTGTTNARGEYLTGLPGAKGRKPHTLKVLFGRGGTIPADIEKPWQTRHRFRGMFMIDPEALAALGVHQDVDRAVGWHYAPFVTDEGIQIQRFNYQGSDDEFEVLEAEDIDSAQVAWHPNGYLGLVYGQNGTVKYVESYSHGESWSDPVTIGDGTYPAYCIDQVLGIEFCALWEADDWKLYRRLPGEDFEFLADIASSTAEAAAGLEVGSDPLHRLVFVYNDGTEIVRLYSTDQGETWNA